MYVKFGMAVRGWAREVVGEYLRRKGNGEYPQS
jgi:hypothetical protein